MGHADDIGIIGKKHVTRRERVDREAFEQRGNELESRAEMRWAWVAIDSVRPCMSHMAVEQSARSLIFGE